MSGKNKVYLAGLAMYLIASLAGVFIDKYWVILIASVLVVMFTVNCVFNENDTENLKDTMKFDWMSIFAFACLELILTFCISLLSLPLTGFLGSLNLLVQILGYVFIGYSIVRYTLDNTEVVDFVKSKCNFKKQDTVVVEEIKNVEVAEKVEEVIKEEVQTESFTDVFEDMNEVLANEVVEEPEIVAIEYKKEEEEIVTPYMEEEI